jgi:hypothetical protein
MGDRDQAVRWLERGAATETYTEGFVEDQFLRGLRAEPRYAAVLRRVGYPPDLVARLAASGTSTCR